MAIPKKSPTPKKAKPKKQRSLFEEDFIRRSLGELGERPEVALGELVANAWDAGATLVDIQIPASTGGELVVRDDGTGLTEQQFLNRWMKLGYSRYVHQGLEVEFPPERDGLARRAYGRNGQGRHGLLCFGDRYEVKTTRDGECCKFRVETASEETPFHSELVQRREATGHGTELRVVVEQNRPDPNRIRDLLALRFVHDPSFTTRVNGQEVPFEELTGLSEPLELNVGSATLRLSWLEADPKAKHKTGVAFWVGNRLVGEPSWTVGGDQLHDGRTTSGKRLTFIARTDDLREEVKPDWTGFKKSDFMDRVFDTVAREVTSVITNIMRSRIDETRRDVLSGARHEIESLDLSDQAEVVDIVEAVTSENPLVDPESVKVTVKCVAKVKHDRSVANLIERIEGLPPEDVEGINRLLDQWSVRDALTVLDEISRRMRVIEVLEKLSKEKAADELHTLHPLVTQARWLFGPQYESASFASNSTIRRAIESVFEQQIATEAFENPRKRPDLLLLKNSTMSVVGAEDVDPDSGLATLKTVLLIELKKGKSTIGRDEVFQAIGYVQDILRCGLLEGQPKIFAFVVGDRVSDKVTRVHKVGEHDQARVEAVTFTRLTRTADARLMRLRGQVREFYPTEPTDLLDKLRRDKKQQEQLGLDWKAVNPAPKKSMESEAKSKTATKEEAQ